jgi:putative transposase
MDGCSVPLGPAARQELFWTWVDHWVADKVVGLLQAVLQALQQEQLAAGWNQRTGGRRGYRNGAYVRGLVTAHGPLQVKIPRCRDGTLDCSDVFDRYQRRLKDVDRILRRLYLTGSSTRATAELAEQIFGGQLSHQTVSQLSRWFDEQLAAWRKRPIEPIYRAVFIDGMHLNMLGQDQMVMLVLGMRDDGSTEVLGFSVNPGEQCKHLLEDLRRRGLEKVDLFVSDESSAIRAAVADVFPESAWQHCTFHRLLALWRDIGDKPHRWQMVKAAARVFRCPSKPAAVEQAVAWASQWRDMERSAVWRFMIDLTDSLMFYSLPKEWWKRVRTNNKLERLIRTLRMRLNNMGVFHDASAVNRAVFGQLARWHLLGTYTQ